jgi:hypothetical protein
MTPATILAAKVAYQRMHPDRVLYCAINVPRGSARDRRRYIRRMLVLHPDPWVRLISESRWPDAKEICLPDL